MTYPELGFLSAKLTCLLWAVIPYKQLCKYILFVEHFYPAKFVINGTFLTLGTKLVNFQMQ